MIPEIWPIIFSGISPNKALNYFRNIKKILQKLSKIPKNSQKFRFFFIVRPLLVNNR